MNKSEYKNEIIWTGDLNDDCNASWRGLMLRAEKMDESNWWWRVYDTKNNDLIVDDSNQREEECLTGEIARSEAEKAARKYLAT